MEEYKKILKKIGLALVMAGALDAGYMVYCIASEINYSASFSIVAIIAGIYLIRGNMNVALIVRWLSAFFLTAITGSILLSLTTEPPSLLLTRIEVSPVQLLSSLTITILFCALLYWIYRQLNKPAMIEAFATSGVNVKKTKSAFIAGAVCALILTSITIILLYSESAQKAKLLAAEKCGSKFNYHVSSLRISGDLVKATVTAYNKEEIKDVEITW